MLRINKVTLAALLVAALALPGCAAAGGAATEGAKSVLDLLRSDPDKSLRTAVGKSEDVKSVAVSITGTESGAAVNLAAKLQFGAQPAAELTVTDNGKPMTVLIHGPILHMSVPAEEAKTFKGKKWLMVDTAKLTPAQVKEIGLNPAEFNKTLEELKPKALLQRMLDVGAFKVAGEETVDGVKTVHYKSVVPVARLVGSEKPAEQAADAKRYKAANVKEGVFDIWVDEQYQLRKADLIAGSVDNWTAAFTGHDQPLDLALPPASVTVDVAQLLAQAPKKTKKR